MDSGNEHPGQIPTVFNEENTLQVVRKQSQIPGERKEKTINDFPGTAAIAQTLKNLHFPTNKQTIITFVKSLDTPQSREVLSLIEKKLDNARLYENVSEITETMRLVE